MSGLEEVPDSDRGKVGQQSALRRQVQRITAAPSVNLVHVLLPHHLYALTPWEVASTDPWRPNELPGRDDPRHDRAFAEVYATQAMQVAAVDDRGDRLVEGGRDRGVGRVRRVPTLRSSNVKDSGIPTRSAIL